MKKIVHHLRRQSEQVRKHILHLSIIIAAFILLSFWVYSLGAHLSSPDTQAKMKEDLKPFAAFKDNLVGGYHNIVNDGTSAQ